MSHLSPENEAKIRSVLEASPQPMPASVLVQQLRQKGIYHSYAYSIIGAAVKLGMLERTTAAPPYRYQLKEGYVRPAAAAQPRAAAPAERPTSHYVGPVFASGPLVPSLGACGISQEEVEGELPPYLGGAIVDSLHRGFHEIFNDVE